MTVRGVRFTFCDDVRLELGGKVSVIGIARDFIGIPADKVTVGKFVVYTEVDYDRQAIGEAVRLQIRDRDREILGIDLALPERQQPAPVPELEDQLHLIMPVELAGLELTPGMEIQAALTIGEDSHPSEVLRVIRAQPNPGVIPIAALAPKAVQ